MHRHPAPIVPHRLLARSCRVSLLRLSARRKPRAESFAVWAVPADARASECARSITEEYYGLANRRKAWQKAAAMGRRLIPLVLFLVTFCLFSRVLVADFVAWDDDISVTANPHVKGLDWAHVRWMFGDVQQAMRYEPLSWLTYALVYEFSGLRPFGYHLANLLFHSLNAVLLFVVIRRLLAAGSADAEVRRKLGEATWPAALGTLLWALNPLRVEPVAQITHLRYCLLTAFLLVSLWAYLRAAGRATASRLCRCFYWGAVLAFAASMLSLPFAFSFVVVLIVLDWYPLRRFESAGIGLQGAGWGKVLLGKLPFALLGGLVLLTLLGRLSPVGAWAQSMPESRLPIPARLMQAFYVWGYYLWKAWMPLHLSPVYTTLVSFNPVSVKFLVSAGLVGGLTALLVWKRRQWPWALAAWVCHLVLLAPALGWTEHPHYTSDRYGYVPGMVWAVLLAAMLWRLRRVRRVFVGAASAALVLTAVFGALSIRQAGIWRDSARLFQHMLAQLGSDPYQGDVHWRLAQVYTRQGRLDEAIEQYRLALQYTPKPSAELSREQAMQIEAETHTALAELLLQQGRTGEGVAHYRAAVQLEPRAWFVLNNLAWVLATAPAAADRNGTEAVAWAEQACTLTGRRQPLVVGTLAAAYAEAGRFSEAIATAEEAAALAEQSQQPELAKRNRQLLELYRAHKPARDGP